MAYTFDRKQDSGLGDYIGYQTIAPTTESSPSGLLGDGRRGLIGDAEGIRPTAWTQEQQSHQPSLGAAIVGAIVLIGAVWLTAKILGGLFGSSADLTAVERQILASA